MRKTLAIALLALSLGGCAQLSTVGSGISLITKSVTNPVTTQDLYAVEASVRIAVTALQTYKRACLANAADKQCRANIAAIQPYTRQIPPMLAQLRSFVRQNDQVNAAVVYNQLVTLYGNLKASALALGVNLGG